MSDNVFDPADTPLETGTTLIEASAGTGKTYSLTAIILRLILEQHIPISQILAVTYTVAATAELKERVRRRLHEAVEEFRTGPIKDPILSRAAEADSGRALRDAELALASFDEAQIFTIHSFCQRVLQDHAFETGSSFDSRLVTDNRPLHQQVAIDFWRICASRDELLSRLMLAWEETPDAWAELLGRTGEHPDMKIVPAAPAADLNQLIRVAARQLDEIATEWRANGKTIRSILETDKGLSRNAKSFGESQLALLLAEVDQACSWRTSEPACLSSLVRLGTERLRAATKKNHTPPAHRFFDLCDGFSAAATNAISKLTHDFLTYAGRELPKRKAATNTVNFDDLVLRVRSALVDDRSGTLANVIGARYRAALVDEFQDTSPAQYDVFQKVFGRGAHHLFYIGDPKQSIYGFRGADIFTYLRAASDATRRHTLQFNWRSEAGLVAAVNDLFMQTKHPFVLDKIRYRRVNAASRPAAAPASELPESWKAPLSLRFIPSSGEKGLNAGDSTAAVCEAVGEDIRHLMQSGCRIGGRPVVFADLAVLVRTHVQGQQLRDALRRRGIRSIIQSKTSVFASEEATHLQRLLSGVLQSNRESALKAALVTELIGLTGDDLVKLEGCEAERQLWLDRFARWRSRWADNCFIAMFRQVLVEQAVRERLAKMPDGERRLTDLLHLGELLHTAESELRLSPDGLAAWLRSQRELSKVSPDEYQLRLESDRNAVQIVTIHACKGLEYPITFCPFLWTAPVGSKEQLLFHDRTDHDRFTIALGASKDEHLAWHREEDASERARTMYVALTRAKNRCRIYVPDYQKISSSTLALLFDEELRADLGGALRNVAANASDRISITDEPPLLSARATELPSTGPARCAPRIFNGRIDQTAMVASFTALNRGGKGDVEETRPEVSDPPVARLELDATAGDSIVDLPRGARAGDFFHAVLQRLDFSAAVPETLVIDQLQWHGLASTPCRGAVMRLLGQLPEVELLAGMALRDIPPDQRTTELEFTFRLKRTDPSRLRALLERAKLLPPDLQTRFERLQFQPVEGFLRGFIDLFFAFQGRYYLLDWKSNWLGPQPTDYEQEGMAAAMIHHNYYLQADLYSLAADLILQQQVPGYDYDTHFGGIFYLFLRGVDPSAPGRGVFHRRLEKESMEILKELAA